MKSCYTVDNCDVTIAEDREMDNPNDSLSFAQGQQPEEVFPHS